MAERAVLIAFGKISHGEARKQASPLGYEHDTKIDDLFRGHAGKVVVDALDHRGDASGVQGHHAHDALHERALAVAIRAEQGNGLAIAHGERDTVEDLHRTIAGAQPLDA